MDENKEIEEIELSLDFTELIKDEAAKNVKKLNRLIFKSNINKIKNIMN